MEGFFSLFLLSNRRLNNFPFKQTCQYFDSGI